MLRSLVLLNVQGRDLMGFVEEAKEKVSKAIEIPKGYSIVSASTRIRFVLINDYYLYPNRTCY